VDTACSSSLLAMQLALDAIRQDQCDAAVVAGSNLTLAPTSSLQFLRLNMLSPQGKCQSFDANGREISALGFQVSRTTFFRRWLRSIRGYRCHLTPESFRRQTMLCNIRTREKQHRWIQGTG